MQQAHDYLAEASELANILANQPESIFAQTTLFKSWTINDVIGHLYMFDVAALKTLQSADEFDVFYTQISERLDQGNVYFRKPIPVFEGFVWKTFIPKVE